MSTLQAPSNPIHAILERLTADATHTSRSRRREEHRFAVQAPAQLGIIPGHAVPDTGDCVEPPHAASFKPVYHAWVTDLSQVGLGMLTEQELPVGAAMWINLEALADSPILLPVRIIYCTRLLPGTHRLGATFL